MTAYQIFTAVMNALSIIYGIVTVIMGTAFCVWLWQNRENLSALYRAICIAIATVHNMQRVVKERETQEVVIAFTIHEKPTEEDQLTEEDQPTEPDPRLINSMCMRWRHDFGLLKEDNPEKEFLRRQMKKVWEEVVGLGFYRNKESNDYDNN
jgi:hypothetical protein